MWKNRVTAVSRQEDIHNSYHLRSFASDDPRRVRFEVGSRERRPFAPMDMWARRVLGVGGT